jgi:hypothetical protein
MLPQQQFLQHVLLPLLCFPSLVAKKKVMLLPAGQCCCSSGSSSQGSNH